MRSIKFRIWDKYCSYFGYFSLNNGIPFIIYKEPEYINRSDLTILPYGNDNQSILEIYCLQQYTGVKDRNEREIYEGDILEIGLNLGTTETVIREVRYHELCSQFGVLDLYNQYTDLNYSNKKVIGNIYETPELLNRKLFRSNR